jgi:hypothetical protein
MILYCQENEITSRIGGEVPRLVAVEGELGEDGRWLIYRLSCFIITQLPKFSRIPPSSGRISTIITFLVYGFSYTRVCPKGYKISRFLHFTSSLKSESRPSSILSIMSLFSSIEVEQIIYLIIRIRLSTLSAGLTS